MQKVKFTYMSITSVVIIIETSNQIHVIVFIKGLQIEPSSWPLTLTLKRSSKVKKVEKITLHRTMSCSISNQRSWSTDSKYATFLLLWRHWTSQRRHKNVKITNLAITSVIMVIETSNQFYVIVCNILVALTSLNVTTTS